MSYFRERVRFGLASTVHAVPCLVPPEVTSAWCDRVLLERYRLLHPVGMGGSGVVFAAEDLARGDRAAVKLLLGQPHLRVDMRRLRLEAEVACLVSHPNLVGFRDVGIDASGTAFIVTDLLEGMTLAELLKAQRNLDTDTALTLLLPIIDTVAHVHDCGVLHRDIKPENLYLAQSPDGSQITPKLIDFGIAKRRELPSHTLEGLTLGTPAYMSPEQALAEPLTCASDVWSLGVVLFECLSGRLPFEATSSTGLLLKLVNGHAPRLAPHAPHVPAAIASVVDRALLRDPGARFPTAHALGRALVLAANANPPAARRSAVSC